MQLCPLRMTNLDVAFLDCRNPNILGKNCIFESVMRKSCSILRSSRAITVLCRSCFCCPSFLFLFLYSSLLLLLVALPQVKPDDSVALLALKGSIDPLGVLPWGKENDVCKWIGVKECINGRVTKLVVERCNLTGTLDGKSLNQLYELRVLSFNENFLYGQIPEVSGLKNLKSVFLNKNRFSGEIPASLSLLLRLKVIVLSDNRLSGQIPGSLVDLPRLYVLYLQANQLTGAVPPLNQSSLRFLNVSNNALSGEIPQTEALMRVNGSSFIGNIDLCGDQIQRPCSLTPSQPIGPAKSWGHGKGNKKVILIIMSSIGGLLLLCIVAFMFVMCLRKTSKENEMRDKVVAPGVNEGTPNQSRVAQGRFSLDRNEVENGIQNLTFLASGDQVMSYSLEDLLNASAETLGKGATGSTYKAVMKTGYIVTVKRLTDGQYPRIEEFRRHIEILGRLRHPNLVPLRAYFQVKEDRLLVYEYFPNGSLFSLLHGSRASGGSKPLHWTSCLKIAEDLAAGLLYIHQNPSLTHGNLKSTNVLLGPEFESCLTDYGLTPFRNPHSHEECTASSVFYIAPECRDIKRPSTQAADVYSYGILLLELLTGKSPSQDLVHEQQVEIPKWIQSVREEEMDSSSDEPNEQKLSTLVNIAMACVSLVPANRPQVTEILRMIREARAEAHISSNSSDRSPSPSPGRWSDAVQSSSREDHSSI